MIPPDAASSHLQFFDFDFDLILDLCSFDFDFGFMDLGFEFLDFMLMLLLIGFEFMDSVLIRDLRMDLSFFGCFDLDLVRIWYAFDLNFSRHAMEIDLYL